MHIASMNHLLSQTWCKQDPKLANKKRLENQPPHSLFTNIHKQIIGQKNSQATESTLLGKTSNERNVVRMSLKQKNENLFPSFQFKHIKQTI